jgi:hypothetical protein
MALKVIGAGFGRTGTLSLKLALEQLGFGPCYHMTEVFRLGSERLWLDAADGRPDWEGIFDGFAATVDWPGAAFYAELADTYPEARVILTVRDAEAWFRSTQRRSSRMRRRRIRTSPSISCSAGLSASRSATACATGTRSSPPMSGTMRK